LAHGLYSIVTRKLIVKEYILQNEKITMIITPFYYCRNCRKFYPGNKLEISHAPIEKLVSAARYTLGSQDHIFRIGGKSIQLSDLHHCNDHEVGLANFIKIQITKEEKE
jgi:hypothetical protein